MPRATKSPTDKLRALLKKHDLPQVRAAKLLGIDNRTVRRWLQDPKTPGFRECPAWAPEALAARLDEERLMESVLSKCTLDLYGRKWLAVVREPRTLGGGFQDPDAALPVARQIQPIEFASGSTKISTFIPVGEEPTDERLKRLLRDTVQVAYDDAARGRRE